jgi:hypothetical protein
MSEINIKNIDKLDWMTIPECAAALHYKDPMAIYNAIKAKQLRAFKFERRKVLVLKEDLLKFILSKQTAQPQTVKPSLKEQLAAATKA